MRFALALILVFGACSEATGPIIGIEGERPYTNPSLVLTWAILEQCSGIDGDFSKVQFFTATSITYGDGYARGLWEPKGNRIYILATETANVPLVKHEMMHALLQANGHPARFFNGVCGDLIHT